MHKYGRQSTNASIYDLKNDLSDVHKYKDEIVDYELEKIWSLYDIDDNGTLDFDEMREYIQTSAFKSLNLTDRQVKEIYLSIDRDNNGTIDREELAKFLKILLSQLQNQIRENKSNTYKFLNKLKCPETDVSRDIRITAEVEKIWIIYDTDDNGILDFAEVKDYIKKTAFASKNLDDDQVQELYETIDRDGNGKIDRQEMAQFLNLLVIL